MNSVVKLPHIYTYADYAQWPDEQRWELINGEAYAITAPLRVHQKIVTELGRQIGNYLQGKSCEIYVAPFDIRLSHSDEADEQINTVVHTDISIICDKAKLDQLGCRGAPDWIIEVLSPSTILRDMNTKRSLYEQHGVQVYWIIHPEEQWIMVYTLDTQARYGKPDMFGMNEPTAVQLFPDLTIDWAFMAAV